MIVRCSLTALCCMAGLLLLSQPGSAQFMPPKDEPQTKEALKIQQMQAELKALQAEMEMQAKVVQAEMEKRRAAIEKAMQQEMKAIQAEMEKRRDLIEKKSRELRDAMMKSQDKGRGQPRIQSEPVPPQPLNSRERDPRAGRDTDRRLADIERKLDQIIDELAKLRRPRRGSRGSSPCCPSKTPCRQPRSGYHCRHRHSHRLSRPRCGRLTP